MSTLHQPDPERLLNDRSVLRLVQIALAEDIGDGDLTSESLLDPETQGRAVVKVKEAGVLAGCPVAGLVARTVDPDLLVEWNVGEGSRVIPGTVAGSIRGSYRSMLTMERTFLNVLQRISGVASATCVYVDRIAGTGATILDTRKTIPGWRLLDKYGVRAGGGSNHRMGLYDAIMIKDNHIDAHGSIAGAVAAARRALKGWRREETMVEVETRSLDEVRQALECGGVDRIMFDNFSLDLLREGVAMVAGAVETEASGGVTLDTVRGIAETGVQYISVGAITHSVRALDISLDVERHPS